MGKIYMLTIPRSKCHKREIMTFLDSHDVHRWIVAKETGKGGYEHWQVRLSTSATFDEIKTAFPYAHIEESTQWCNYERKEGRYVCSEDTNPILRCRFGTPRDNQRRILGRIYTQSDRGIDVIVDTSGNHGKSWLSRHLWENGKAYIVPSTINTTQGIIQYIASGYANEGIVIIDIPRSCKWTPQLYEAIEVIKDGLIYDTRYSAKMRDIYGVKVLIMTNTKPQLDKLSKDRWRLWNSNGDPLT